MQTRDVIDPETMKLLDDATKGDAKSQTTLGVCLLRGIGLLVNKSEAVKYFEMAAVQGYLGGQRKLGWCYMHGEGVKKDHANAIKWYKCAAQQGDVESKYSLAVLYLFGSDAIKDESKAINWLQQSAEQKHVDAQYLLAKCYRDGKGVAQNYTQAVKWYACAVKQGHEKGRRRLLALKSKLTNNQRLIGEINYHLMMADGKDVAIADALLRKDNMAKCLGMVDGIIFDYEHCQGNSRLNDRLTTLSVVLSSFDLPESQAQRLYIARALLYKPMPGDDFALNSFLRDLYEIEVPNLKHNQIIPLLRCVVNAWHIAAQSSDDSEVAQCVQSLTIDLTNLLYRVKGMQMNVPEDVLHESAALLIKGNLGSDYESSMHQIDENQLFIMLPMLACLPGTQGAQKTMETINKLLGVNVIQRKHTMLASNSTFFPVQRELADNSNEQCQQLRMG